MGSPQAGRRGEEWQSTESTTRDRTHFATGFAQNVSLQKPRREQWNTTTPHEDVHRVRAQKNMLPEKHKQIVFGRQISEKPLGASPRLEKSIHFIIV